jgi:DnaJ-class molecular chaperone
MTGHEERALVVLAVIGWWAWHAWFHPFRPCPRCHGKGTNPGSNRKRHGDCRRCHGTRRVQRIGSRTVHRAVRAIVTYCKNRKDKP